MQNISIENVSMPKEASDNAEKIVKKSRIRLQIANAKNKKWAYIDNKKTDRKRRISEVKEPLNRLVIKKVSIKKAFDISKKIAKSELRQSIAEAKSLSTEIYIRDEKEKLFDEFENKKSSILLSNKDVNLEISKLEKLLEKDIAKLETYTFENDQVESLIVKAKNVYDKKIQDLSLKLEKDLLKIEESILERKDNTRVKLAKLKNVFKEEEKKIKDEFKQSVKKAKDDYLESKAYLKETDSHINFFNEIVSEKSIDYGEVQFSTKNAVSNLESVGTLRAKLYAKRIVSIEAKILKLESKENRNFDSSLSLISLRIKLKKTLEIAELILNSITNVNRFISSRDLETIRSSAESYKMTLKEIKQSEKNNLVNEINRAKGDYKEGKFSKASLKNTITQAKYACKSNIREAKLKNPLTSYKENLRYMKAKLREDIISRKKIMWSQIDEAQRKVPVKTFGGQKWVTMIASFLLPGLGQAINRQFVKAFIMFVIGVIAYAFFIPSFFGVFSYEGNGIFGLINPSKVIGMSSSGAERYTDARYMIVEGVLSIFLLILWFINTLISSRDAYITAKYAELGIRVKNRRDLKRYLSSNGLPYVISLPAIIGILFTVLLPLATTLLVAFTNYGGTKHTPPTQPIAWVGWDNFKEIFNGDYGKSFLYVSGWTFGWAISITVLVVGVGTLMAMLVDNKRVRGKKIWFMIYILPWAVPAFATILFFSAIFSRDQLTGGTAWINQILGTNIEWKDNTETSFYTRAVLILIQLWLGNAYVFMLMTGVKRSISKDYYEAANIDGANSVKQFTTITAPIILLQLLPLLIGQFTFNLNNYGLIWMFNDGGPVLKPELTGTPGSTDIIISLIFKLTTTSNARVGLAAAFTLFYSIFVVGLSAVGMLKSKTFKKERRYA